jgi:formamidopyrimidine-DNA glycosylase
MPELPEVEMVRRTLESCIVGKTIANVQVLHQKPISHSPSLPFELPGKTIQAVHRRGKLLYIALDDPNCFVAIHLKMTGQLIYQDALTMHGGGHTLTKTDHKLPHKHTRLWLEFTDQSRVFFNDLRLFGYLKILSKTDLEAVLKTYGIEPGMENFTEANFLTALANKTTTIKAALLNQSLISGLGNIYVDEACFYAKVLPNRRIDTLKKAEKLLLFKGCEHVILDSIAHGGTTFYSFVHTDGSKGSYLDKLHVFSRQGKPCYRCETIIKKIKHAGRGTHFCPGCQK